MPVFKKVDKLEETDYPSIHAICAATWEPLYRYVYYKVQNRQEAEDITQETFMKSLPHLQSGRINPDKYMAFLKTVALNVVRDLWRISKRRGTQVDLDTVNPMDHAVEDEAEASVQRMFIEKGLRQLNEEYRTVIELRILQGYSIAQTAKMMNKKEVTLRVLQHRALQSLAQILKNSQ